jgi:hypothetical protein
MPPQTWRADWDIHRIIRDILRHGGDPDKQARDIHQAYIGRGWKAPGPTGLEVTYCKTHTSIKNPCPLCQGAT